MTFILKRTDQGGGYVAPGGQASSYVRDAMQARTFATVEEADRNRCPGNEVIIDRASGQVVRGTTREVSHA